MNKRVPGNNLYKHVHRRIAAYILTQERLKASEWEHTSEVRQCEGMADEEQAPQSRFEVFTAVREPAQPATSNTNGLN